MANSSHPVVSVIIPNYNHERYLRRRIDSVLNQSFQDFEVILLDDSSTDTSAELIGEYQSHPKVAEVILNQQNSGSTFRQWQRGLEVARGKYCWIAESDDVAESGFLARLIPLLDGGAGLAYCNSRIIDGAGDTVTLGIKSATWVSSEINRSDFDQDYIVSGIEEVRRHLIYSNTMYNASAILVRTDILRSVLPGLSSYRLYGDWLAWIRCCMRCDQIAYIAAPLNQFRTHGGNVRSDMSQRYELQLRESSAMRDAAGEAFLAIQPDGGKLLALNRHLDRKSRIQVIREAATSLGARVAFRLLLSHALGDLLRPRIWKSLLAAVLHRGGAARH